MGPLVIELPDILELNFCYNSKPNFSAWFHYKGELVAAAVERQS